LFTPNFPPYFGARWQEELGSSIFFQPNLHHHCIPTLLRGNMAEGVNEQQIEMKSPVQDSTNNILQKQIELLDVQVGYLSLFKYATAKDLIILVISAVFAAVAGVRNLPLLAPGSFSDFTRRPYFPS
jgi:hypothetical protein